MNVKEIVAEYLVANGYGGLHYDECGCFNDDLMPCGEQCDMCEAAYKVPAHCCSCEADCDSRGVADWCLTTEKPTPDNPYGTKMKPCPACKSNNVKFRGSIFNCEDCGEQW